MEMNWLAILAASGAAWLFGAIWYGALGRPWAIGLGLMSSDAPPARGAPPIFALVFSFVAEFVMAIMLSGLLMHLGGPKFGLMPALIGAFFVWIGFVAPAVATNYAYQQRPWPVYAIDLGHWLGVLLVEAAVLALMN
ncbi:MAG: DUF1761 domain-containing protein [Rhodoblastus sp.]